MKGIDDLLRSHPFADGLDPRIVDVMATCATHTSFAANDYIFREGEEAQNFYLIRHGTVALEMYNPGKQAFTFMTLKSGELLGVSWLTPPYRWLYDARAVEVTRLLAFDAQCLRDKCESDPQVGYELMKRFIGPLSQRLQSARVQSADLFHPDAGR